MRAWRAVITVVVLAAASACAGSGEVDFGLEEVVGALTDTGVSVRQTSDESGFPFSVPEQRLAANGFDLSVYEYTDVAAQEAGGSHHPDGGVERQSHAGGVDWVAALLDPGPGHRHVRGRRPGGH